VIIREPEIIVLAGPWLDEDQEILELNVLDRVFRRLGLIFNFLAAVAFVFFSIVAAIVYLVFCRRRRRLPAVPKGRKRQ
jgi:ABC-type sugar transport system permease subunit